MMSSRRLSNADEMVRAALVEESLLPKEKRRRWASYVVDCAIVRCAPPLAGGVSCPYAVVRVMAGDDGVVPERSSGGVAVGVAADDDGVVPGRSGGGVADGGAFEDLVKRRDIPCTCPGRRRWRAWHGDRSSTCSRAKQRL